WLVLFGVSFCMYSYGDPHALHSFPTRRSSDLEELYLVLKGRAVFELDGERVDASTGTFVFARPGVKRTAVAEEPETTIIALGGRSEEHTSELQSHLNLVCRLLLEKKNGQMTVC